MNDIEVGAMWDGMTVEQRHAKFSGIRPTEGTCTWKMLGENVRRMLVALANHKS